MFVFYLPMCWLSPVCVCVCVFFFSEACNAAGRLEAAVAVGGTWDELDESDWTVTWTNRRIRCKNSVLGGGFKYFLFSSLPGEMIQFDDHIFQMGWFNHQLE